MKKSFFDYEKAMNALLYIITEIKDAGIHQSFKTLYRAEQNYIREYGRTILGDTFTKMVDGPAPSHVYDLIKMANDTYEGRWLGIAGKIYAKANLQVNDKLLYALVAPDLDFLAETEKASLDAAIEACRNKSFGDLREESHDEAWHSATMGRSMDIVRIAKAGGADEDTIEYLLESIENSDHYAL